MYLASVFYFIYNQKRIDLFGLRSELIIGRIFRRLVNEINQRITMPDDNKLDKGEILSLWEDQERYIDHLETKIRGIVVDCIRVFIFFFDQ